MAIRSVSSLTYSSLPIGRGWQRSLQLGFGILLGTVPLVLVLFDAYETRPNGTNLVYPELWEEPSRIISRAQHVIILIGLASVGFYVAAARKNTILFLRRFGLDVNLVVSRLISSGLGRHFRAVTLDDSKFPPLGAPVVERLASRLGPVIVAFVLVVTLLSEVATAVRLVDSRADVVDETRRWAIFWLCPIWMLLIFISAHLFRVRRKSRLRIRKEKDVDRAAAEIDRLSNLLWRPALAAPQSVIVTVEARADDELWRKVVAEAVLHTNVVLIDVSDPSVSLAWEIEHLQNLPQPRVFIAEKSRLESWTNTDSNGDGPAAAITALIGDRPVLILQR